MVGRETRRRQHGNVLSVHFDLKVKRHEIAVTRDADGNPFVARRGDVPAHRR